MMKRAVSALLLTAVIAGCASGCGIYDKEYTAVSEYTQPPAQAADADGEKISVRDFKGLKNAILDIVVRGENDGTIQFDPAYKGDSSEDMASACWEIRSKDALCAYCVENISYELSKIVTYYEAEVHISYSSVSKQTSDMHRLAYFVGVESIVRAAMEEGTTRVVLLINQCTYSAEEVESFVAEVYRSYPASAPKQPRVSVNMYSGDGLQRLYEISLAYGYTPEQLKKLREELAAVQPFELSDSENIGAPELALTACRYLKANCEYTSDTSCNTIYSALVLRSASSEGIALAYVELCRQLGLTCSVVYGQREWQDYCWNIVKIDGEYYHVDVSACIVSGLESGFLLGDEDVWSEYRWDVSSYPVCGGELKGADYIA